MEWKLLRLMISKDTKEDGGNHNLTEMYITLDNDILHDTLKFIMSMLVMKEGIDTKGFIVWR